MKLAAGFVIDHVERWIDLLVDAKDVSEDGWSKAKNMSDWNDWLVFDILGDLLLGRSFGLKEPGENPIRKVPHMMMKHVQMFYPVAIPSFSPRFPPDRNSHPTDHPIPLRHLLHLGHTPRPRHPPPPPHPP